MNYSDTAILPQNAGVYALVCLATGRLYIGSAVSVRKRVRRHLVQLVANKHSNRYLQAAWNTYGADAFKVEVVESCEPDLLLVREQHYLDTVCCNDRSKSFNLSPTAASTKGVKFSPEGRENVAAALRGKPGRPHTPETMALKQAQYRANPEWRWAMAEGLRDWAADNAAKLAADLNRRRQDPAFQAAVRYGQLGHLVSLETRFKIGDANRGKKRTAEVKAKMSASQSGRKHSAETKAKMAATRAAWWAVKQQDAGTGGDSG